VTLALFDVDGTLLLTPDLVAVRAILDAIDPSLPDDAFLRLPHAGQTSLWQVEQILGHEPDPEWCARAERRYEELLGDTSHWRKPDGVDDVLAELAGRGVKLALLTGTPEGMARLRMERLGLAQFFPEGQGAFGCESTDRVELIRLALERSGASPEDAVEIGDTPLDESTAHEAGVRAIRVDELASFSDLLELVERPIG
jgi:phosphoglycolate phosphatase-like HAD superfamily hydrolase